MTRWPCFFGWMVLTAFFLSRYIVVDVILLPTIAAIESSLTSKSRVTIYLQSLFDDVDRMVYANVSKVVCVLEWLRCTIAPYSFCLLFIPATRRYGLWYTLFNVTSHILGSARTHSRRSYHASSSSLMYLIIVTSMPQLRLCGCTAAKSAAFWIEFHRLTRQIPEQSLWIWLENIITFGRISSRRISIRECLKTDKPNFLLSPWYQLLLFLVPSVIRMSTLVFLFCLLHKHCTLSFSFSNSSTNASFNNFDGYSAIISSCYDGDTCRTDQLLYNGHPLPDLFSKINIRLRGIDAPEQRHRAKCSLENCLANRAKNELERIIFRHSNQTTRWRDARLNLSDLNEERTLVHLTKCKKDKYGGRIVCDILTEEELTTVSAIMTTTGLVVPYWGNRKTQDWCDLNEILSIPFLFPTSRQQDRIRTSLQGHLSVCGVDLS